MDNKIKVVVAEDIEILAIKMSSIIATNEKVEKVHYALNGEDAIQEIMNLNADLVFTDMQMPKRTGLEVIEAILGYPCVRKKPKFVLVTADRDSYLINKSWELGFDIEYKPISAERIHEYINGFEPVKIDTKAEKKKMKEYLKEVREELRKRRKMAK